MKQGDGVQCSHSALTPFFMTPLFSPSLLFTTHSLQLDKGQRLLRLHCPWSTGQWTGAWSNSSNDWTLPAAQSHLDYFAPTLEDDATFWISYE